MISMVFKLIGVLAKFLKFLPAGVFSIFTYERHYHHHYGEKHEYKDGEVPERVLQPE